MIDRLFARRSNPRRVETPYVERREPVRDPAYIVDHTRRELVVVNGTRGDGRVGLTDARAPVSDISFTGIRGLPWEPYNTDGHVVVGKFRSYAVGVHQAISQPVNVEVPASGSWGTQRELSGLNMEPYPYA